MKKNRSADLLPFGVLLLSAGSFALRKALYTVALDEKNLLLRGHPLALCLWLCTGVAVLVSLAAARQGYKVKHYAANFESSLLSALGHILAASGILLTMLMNPAPEQGVIGKLWKVSGIISCLGLYWAAFSRARGERPFFGCYGLLSVFFALHLVANYQTWCSDPQLQNYVFAFLGSLSLMLFSYHQAAFCVDTGSSFLLRLTGLLAVCFCVTGLAHGVFPYLYGGCALWSFTGLSRLCPRRERKAGDSNGPA